MPRNFNWNRRPITRATDTDGQESAAKILEVIEAGLRSNLGTDDDRSPLLDALAKLEGADEDAMELAQDCGLLAADVLAAVRENLDNPAGLAGALLLLTMGAVPEIKSDIDAVKD